MKQMMGMAIGAGGVLMVDQISKWASYALPEEGVRLFPGVSAVQFTNSHLAGSIRAPTSLILALAICALLLVGIVVWRRKAGSAREFLGWAAIMGGGISNLADRFLRNGVLDILRVGPVSYINLADIFIILGIMLVLTAHRGVKPVLTPNHI